jgi:hypothetical protein
MKLIVLDDFCIKPRDSSGFSLGTGTVLPQGYPGVAHFLCIRQIFSRIVPKTAEYNCVLISRGSPGVNQNTLTSNFETSYHLLFKKIRE